MLQGEKSHIVKNGVVIPKQGCLESRQPCAEVMTKMQIGEPVRIVEGNWMGRQDAVCLQWTSRILQDCDQLITVKCSGRSDDVSRCIYFPIEDELNCSSTRKSFHFLARMFRNPSPPPDIPDSVLKAGELGETGYSQHWLFGLLSQLIKVVNEESDTSASSEDVDEQLEEDLCQLWDLTLDSDVLKLLQEYKIVMIVTGVVEKSNQQRLIEICIGILANMARHESVCDEITSRQDTREIITALLSCRDSAVLTETSRLLRVCLANSNCKIKWRDALHRTECESKQNIMFIFKSSKSGPLLKQAIGLLEVILSEEDDLSRDWCQSDVLEAVIEGYRQLRLTEDREDCAFYSVLYHFSSSQEGVVPLVSQLEAYYELCVDYVTDITDDEVHLLTLDNYSQEIRSIVPVLDVVLNAVPPEEVIPLLEEDTHLFVNLLKIAQACLSHSSWEASDGILRDLSLYFQDLVLLTLQVTNAKWPKQLDTQSNINALKAFFTCLASGCDCFEQLHQICKDYNLIYLPEELKNYESSAT